MLQDGRKDAVQLLPIDAEDWEYRYIGGYRVYYRWELQFHEKVMCGYEAYAYWYYDNALMIVNGRLTEEEILAVAAELIGG